MLATCISNMYSKFLTNLKKPEILFMRTCLAPTLFGIVVKNTASRVSLTLQVIEKLPLTKTMSFNTNILPFQYDMFKCI